MANSSGSSPLFEYLDTMLDEGSISPKCSSCCPDCGNLYVIASVETYLVLFNSTQLTPQEDCCTNTCITQFQQFTDSEGFQRFLDKGMVEYSTFNGKSFLCYLLDYCITYPSALEDSSFSEVIDRILDKGIVIYCSEDTQFVGCVETFLSYIEPLPSVNYGGPCCISVNANSEEYLQYLEGTGQLTPPPPAA